MPNNDAVAHEIPDTSDAQAMHEQAFKLSALHVPATTLPLHYARCG
jgi:hypothetical protein